VARHKIDFTPHPGVTIFEKGSSGKVVMYQMNPLPNWGPGTKAKTLQGGGKKGLKAEDTERVEEGEGEGEGGEKRKIEDSQEEGVEEKGKRLKVDDMVDEEEGLNA